MRALRLIELTGPDGLELAEVDDPVAGDNVLVEVRAAGVSFPDLLLTRGEYQMRAEPPFVPGIEVAGTVREAPAGSGFSPGDRVAAQTPLGGWAELALAPPSMTFPLPEPVDFAAGAALLMNYQTALFALERRGRLAAGETVLVHGAGGGTGTAAVQTARALGATAFGVASPGTKADAALEAGAEAVTGPDADWVAWAREQTGGRGVDIVFDPVGGERLGQSLRCMAPEGRLLVIGFADGSIPEIAANRVLLRNVDIVGVNWGGFVAVEPGYPAECWERIAALAAEGTLAPVIGGRYPLADAGQALRDLAGRRAVGKLILEMA